MTDSHFKERRHLLILALISPMALPGCGGSGDGTHVQVGDATKAEVKARAEAYRARTLLKKQKNASRR